MAILLFLFATISFITVTCMSLFTFSHSTNDFYDLLALYAIIFILCLYFPFSLMGIALAYMISKEMP